MEVENMSCKNLSNKERRKDVYWQRKKLNKAKNFYFFILKKLEPREFEPSSIF